MPEEFMFLDYAHGVSEKLPILIVADEAFMPAYAQAGDAGADLRASEAGSLEPGERRLVATGVSVAIPAGYVGLVHPRSGLAAKNGITVLNAPGTVDSGYRGEVKVNLFNSSSEVWHYAVGDRIAQIVFQRYEIADFVRVETLPGSDRGASGHGSTGVK
jgi:dUTP pyrophosphatase